jgi:hypothetical protein
MKALDAMLDFLREHPGDPATLVALADLLTEAGPTPVQLGECPNWLRLSWLRLHRPGPGRGAGGRRTDGWSVLCQLDRWLGEALGRGWPGPFDHHGRTRVGRHLCFVSEPYADLADARAQAAALGEKLRTVGVGLPEGAWTGGRTVRVLVFPPAALPPPLRGRRAGALAHQEVR